MVNGSDGRTKLFRWQLKECRNNFVDHLFLRFIRASVLVIALQYDGLLMTVKDCILSKKKQPLLCTFLAIVR